MSDHQAVRTPAKCATCRHWESLADEPGSKSRGECRRYAPRVIVLVPYRGSCISDPRDLVFFPITSADDRCGEHSPDGHREHSLD